MIDDSVARHLLAYRLHRHLRWSGERSLDPLRLAYCAGVDLVREASVDRVRAVPARDGHGRDVVLVPVSLDLASPTARWEVALAVAEVLLARTWLVTDHVDVALLAAELVAPARLRRGLSVAEVTRRFDLPPLALVPAPTRSRETRAFRAGGAIARRPNPCQQPEPPNAA